MKRRPCICECMRGAEIALNGSQMTVSGKGWLKAVKRPIPIMVKQMDADFFVQTLSGKLIGRKGDYLAVDKHGERFIIRENSFLKDYEVIEW